MTHLRFSRAGGLALALVAAQPAAVQAQSLAQRVARAGGEAVSFSFPVREGVCGNGHGMLMIGPSTWVGSWNGEVSRESCERGPARVQIAKADGLIVDVRTEVGPPPATATPGVTDLGRVSGAEAAAYLLSIASMNDGKPGRDAILPASIADSTSVAPQLLALARDQARARETRRTAISWLARLVDRQGGGGLAPERIVATLGELARDERDAQPVRQHALSTLARFERGEGIPALLAIAKGDNDSWLARQAVQALARSGDPRARQFLRDAAKRSDLGEEVRVTVLHSLGGEYATGADAAFLRELYPSIEGERARDAVLGTLAEMGGTDNAKWLLAVARDEKEQPRLRRRAVQLADRAGIPADQLVALYDQAGDRDMKEGLIGAYGQLGTRAATDKLLAIAKTDTDYQLRRRAIQLLGRSDDPRVRDALKGMVEK